MRHRGNTPALFHPYTRKPMNPTTSFSWQTPWSRPRRAGALKALQLLLSGLMVCLIGAAPAFAQAEYSSRALERLRPSAALGFESSLDRLNRTIDVHVNQMSLGQALDEVASRAGFRVVKAQWEALRTREVSLNETGVTVLAALYDLMEGSGLGLKVSPSGYLVVVAKPSARPVETAPVELPPLPLHPVTGAVISADDNLPLPGVNVFVKGTATGAATDLDGRYALDAPSPNDTLVFSFVGYLTQEIPIQGRTTIDVQLEEDQVQLDEVVVVGYGEQKRSDITGSVASISPERLEEVPAVNVTQSLQGAIPGLQVTLNGAGAEQNDVALLMRGQNSITASNRPLIIVDGIPYSGALSEINQNDVASIEVLKDASSAAIYGSRGSNGVILITTKKGKEGKPVFSYDGYAGVQDVIDVPDVMNGQEFYDFKCVREGYVRKLSCDDPAARAIIFTPTELAVYESGAWPSWWELATQQGFQQQHNLSFSGGTGSTRYYIAGSLLDVEGVAVNDQFRRYTMRVNLDQRMASWLQFGTSTQLSQSDRGGVPASFDDAFYMNPLTRAYNDDGTLTIRTWEDAGISANPLRGLLATDDDLSRRVITSNFAQVDLPFVEGLSFRINGGLDYENRDRGRYYGRNTQTGVTNNGWAQVVNTNSLDWTLENILRYSQSFGKHNVDLTTLYSAQATDDKTVTTTATGFPLDVLTYFQYDVASLVETSYNFPRSRLVSQMARLNYNYNSKYLLTLTGRRDGASVFGANNKYGFFPSIALGWNIAEEPFMQGIRPINSLKLRLSYGQNGNQAISPYATLARLQEDSFLNGTSTAPGYVPNTLGNPNLRWETTTSGNLGIDFVLVGGRIQGTFDMYRSRTNDLLLSRAVPSVHGMDRITENIGETKNRGLELALSTYNIDAGDFSWTTDLNLSFNRNEIVDLYGNGQDDIGNRWFIGQPVVVNYGYQFAGIWQEEEAEQAAVYGQIPGDRRALDVNGDGKIDPANDRVLIGSRQPDYVLGMGNTFKFRHWSLNLFVSAIQGISRANTLLDDVVWGDTRRNTIMREHWTPENRSNTVQANRESPHPNLYGVDMYEDASFVRLRDVTLAYSLPYSFLQRLGLSSMRVYVTGKNLLTLSDWTGLDPELGDQTAIPLERSILGGVSFKF